MISKPFQKKGILSKLLEQGLNILLLRECKKVSNLKGVGTQLSKYLKKKKIEKIKDLLFNLPFSETDRSKISLIANLEIGKIQTIKVMVKKLNFPR